VVVVQKYEICPKWYSFYSRNTSTRCGLSHNVNNIAFLLNSYSDATVFRFTISSLHDSLPCTDLGQRSYSASGQLSTWLAQLGDCVRRGGEGEETLS